MLSPSGTCFVGDVMDMEKCTKSERKPANESIFYRARISKRHKQFADFQTHLAVWPKGVVDSVCNDGVVGFEVEESTLPFERSAGALLARMCLTSPLHDHPHPPPHAIIELAAKSVEELILLVGKCTGPHEFFADVFLCSPCGSIVLVAPEIGDAKKVFVAFYLEELAIGIVEAHEKSDVISPAHHEAGAESEEFIRISRPFDDKEHVRISFEHNFQLPMQDEPDFIPGPEFSTDENRSAQLLSLKQTYGLTRKGRVISW